MSKFDELFESSLPWEKENLLLKGPEGTHSIGYGFYGRAKGEPIFRKVGDKFEKIGRTPEDRKKLFKAYDDETETTDLIDKIDRFKHGKPPVASGHEVAAAVGGQEIHVGSGSVTPELKTALDSYLKKIDGLNLSPELVSAGIEAIVKIYGKKKN